MALDHMRARLGARDAVNSQSGSVVTFIVDASSAVFPRDGQGSTIVEPITARNNARTAISGENIGLLRFSP